MKQQNKIGKTVNILRTITIILTVNLTLSLSGCASIPATSQTSSDQDEPQKTVASTAATTAEPKTVSERITYLAFQLNTDIELEEEGDPYKGIIQAVNNSSDMISISDIVIECEDTNIATAEITGASNDQFFFLVTPVSAGETSIYVQTSDGVVSSKSKRVIVNEYDPDHHIEVESVWITESITLDVDETAYLEYKVAPEEAAKKDLHWTSSNSDVAVVYQNGQVTAKSYGETTITATTSNGMSSSCDVTVAFTNKDMNLKFSVARNGGDNIGSEWSHHATINGEPAKNGTYNFIVGETYEFYCYSVESDSYPDEGENTVEHTVTEDDLLNGFRVEVEVCVTENRGKNANKSAYYMYVFDFSS